MSGESEALSTVLDAVKLLASIERTAKKAVQKSSKYIGQKVEFYTVLFTSQTKPNLTRKEDDKPVAKGAKLYTVICRKI